MHSIHRKELSKSDYHVVFSMRNKIIKRTVGKICMDKIQDWLEKEPFKLDSSSAKEVARGIINEGDVVKCSCGVISCTDHASMRIHKEQLTFENTQMSIMLGVLIQEDFSEKEVPRY